MGVVLLGFRHFQQYRSIQEKNANSLSNVILVQNALENWFHTAKHVQMVDEVLIFTDSIQFAACSFDKDFLILRKGNQRDTFSLKTTSFQTENEGNTPYIKSLLFELKDTRIKHAFWFRKEYGKAVLFNWKEKNNEH